MANSNSNFIEFLSQNDPLGLLKVNTPVKPKAVRSILLSNFEEIVNFFEENNREPQHASTDIKEFQLYCRLKAIRESAEMVKELKDFDFYGLLSGSNISNITFDDIIGNDPLNKQKEFLLNTYLEENSVGTSISISQCSKLFKRIWKKAHVN